MPPPAGGRLMGPASSGEQRGPAMTSDAPPSTTLRDTMRAGVRDLSAIWWWFLILGVLWTWFGMYVLSHRVRSLAAVAALLGVSFLLGGVTQLAVAARVREWRWLFIVAGILGVAAAVVTLQGVAELVLGVWAVRAWQRSLLTLVTLVGVWAIFLGVSEIFAAFCRRQATKRVEQLIG